MPGSSAQMRLRPVASEVGAARAFIRATLCDWGIAGNLMQDLELVATELVTNALIHAHGEARLALSRSAPDAVRLTVSDDGPADPLIRVADHEDTSGRGLAIVAALAERWGVEPDPPGKHVWAECVAAPVPTLR